jgi:GT2 family glycosyltransferase
LFDSLHHMRNDELIRKYSGAATANLFVRRELFRQLGLFRADVRSGGDMMWTRAATTAGFRLVYAPLAVVHHPLRPAEHRLRRIGAGRLCAGWSRRCRREQRARRDDSSRSCHDSRHRPRHGPPHDVFRHQMWDLVHHAVL